MNNKFYAFALTVLMMAGSVTTAFAQQKIGHINSNELMMAMPEREQAAKKYEEKREEFFRQSEELQVELNRKYENYLMRRDSLTPLIRQTKEAELNDMSRNIETFNAAADQELTRIQQEIFQPVIEKAQNAIKEVAAENGFTYILDVGTGAVLYFPEKGAEDILPLVKKKLGLE